MLSPWSINWAILDGVYVLGLCGWEMVPNSAYSFGSLSTGASLTEQLGGT